ncbi:MAG: histidine kinase dimerization/phospho-acceptor domain-containing protein, partial [Anaerolineae bacterium]
MDFEVWRPWARLAFFEPNVWQYALLALHSLLSLGILVYRRRDFTQLDQRRLLLLFGCLLAPLLSERLLVLRFTGRDLLPPPGVPSMPPEPFTPLLGMLPIVVSAAWLGPGPALLVGMSRGFARAGTTTGGVADPFHLALFGFLIGFLLRQDYRGRLPLATRQPAVAVPLMTPFAAVLLLASSFAQVADSGLSGFDYAVTLTGAYFTSALLESLVAALVAQSAYVFSPQLRPVRAPRRSPPYSRTLNRRLLFLFVPLIGLITVVLVYPVTATALRLARSEAIDRMARDASSAADGIPYFIQTGQGLLAEFATDPGLWTADPTALESRLRRDIRTVVFFDQLLLVDSNGQPAAAYPPPPTGGPQLTSQEEMILARGLESGATQISHAHRSQRGLVILSFLAPMADPQETEQGSAPSRALLGRAQLDVNPIIDQVLASLQWANAEGEGFVVSSEGFVVAHPDSNMLLTEHRVAQERSRVGGVSGGWAYEGRNPRNNTRELVYHLPVEGYPWVVLIRLPYEVVLEQARRIAIPLLGLQVLLGGGLVVVVSLVTNRLTQPLQQLAGAADQIAEGDLSHAVEIPGQDEVARVGEAFEEMRLRLKDRMEDLSLLLEVSQAVSATLDLSTGVPFILAGALRATGAQVAHLVLLSADGEVQEAMSCGEPPHGLRALDRALAETAKDRGRPLIIENLERARTLFGSAALTRVIKAVIAVPIRTKGQVAAVMWVGHGRVRRFDHSDLDLLSTLASQTAVLVENARLFQSAEGERGRLAAILASTNDAVLVTDPERRVLLINPAAERAFRVRADRVSSRRIDEASLPRALVDIFEEPLDLDEALTRELSLPDGRTLYANVSAILSADGQRLGRVAVMRDITHLKELDELKSEFVATVSHDLRSPLTFVRGYARMLPSVGELNAKQLEYVKRILVGVGQIGDLVDDLLDLGRIEAGVGLERQACHLGAILTDAVDSMRARAADEGITLHIDPVRGSGIEPDAAVIVSGDPP